MRRVNEQNTNNPSHDDDEIDVGRFFELAEAEHSNIQGLNVYEIRDRLEDDDRGFELIGNKTMNKIKRKTDKRFKNMDDFEAYIEKIEGKYDGEDVVFEGDVFKFDKPEFNRVKRSNYGKGSNHLFDIEEYFGTNCYIPTGKNCFVKCINYLTGEDYTQQYLEFISDSDRRKNVMTLAKIQPFCKKYNIDLGYFNGKQVKPVSVKERHKCLYLHNNHFCCIWGDSLKKATQEIEANFKLINNSVITTNINKYKEYNFKPNNYRPK